MRSFVKQCITAHRGLAGGEKCEVSGFVSRGDDFQQCERSIVQHEVAFGGLFDILNAVACEVDPAVVLQSLQDGFYETVLVLQSAAINVVVLRNS